MKYICVSGGADSTALALLMWERGEEFKMIFSDTGAELPETYWLLPRLAERINKELIVVSNGGFFQHLVAYGFLLPGPMVRWCTRLLKQVPQDRYLESVGAEEVLIGIRADEPRRLHTNEKPRHGKHQFIYPLAEAGYDKKAVKQLCIKYELLNPVYSWRTNVSCFCCFFQRMSDWKGLLRNHPTLFGIAEEWERQSISKTEKGCSWIKGRKLRDLRLVEMSQIKIWPEPEEEPCLICSV